MAQRQKGFTRASALGPIADFVDNQGGSIARVLNDVDLPHAILETPDMPVPLPEQFRLLARAARETGDPHFGARLGQNVRIENLSAFGQWVSEAPNAGGAIERSNRGLNVFLQTGTILRLQRRGDRARWSIEFLDPGTDGRYQNELLGLSYLTDVVRSFIGPGWTPDLVRTTTARSGQRGILEQIFAANISTGHRVSSIEFPSAYLAASNRYRAATNGTEAVRLEAEPAVPQGNDQAAAIVAVASLALLEGYPRIDWVADKLGMTRRSLQRRLSEQGTTFSRMIEDLLLDRSKALLAAKDKSITEIALRMGYTDAAHFSRAFKRWTGASPSIYRRAAQE